MNIMAATSAKFGLWTNSKERIVLSKIEKRFEVEFHQGFYGQYRRQKSVTSIGPGFGLSGFTLYLLATTGRKQINIKPSENMGFDAETSEQQVIKHRSLFHISLCIVATGTTLQFVAALINS